MKRRDFFKLTALGAVAIAVAPSLFIEEKPVEVPFTWELIGARERQPDK